MLKNIVILGTGGLAKEVLFLLDRNNKQRKVWNILGFIDNELSIGTDIMDYKIIGNDSWLLEHNNELFAVCAIANPILKRKLVTKISQNPKISFPTIIDTSVILSKHSFVGIGCIISAGTILTVDVKLGDFVYINFHCTVGHGSFIDNYTTVYPNCNISGNVTIGKLSELGIGTKIIPEISIADNVIIGAGSVVIRNVMKPCTLVGNPARSIEKGLV